MTDYRKTYNESLLVIYCIGKHHLDEEWDYPFYIEFLNPMKRMEWKRLYKSSLKMYTEFAKQNPKNKHYAKAIKLYTRLLEKNGWIGYRLTYPFNKLER